MQLQAAERPNPYVGPNPIPAGHPIFGRDREISELLNMLIASRIVLVYSPSGAGKSSLIEAGLRNRLTARNFQVLPTIRVGHDLGPGLHNRYLASTLLSLEEEHPTGTPLDPNDLTSLGLEGYLQLVDERARAKASTNDRTARPCLIFDQFEELFTTDPVDYDKKAEFLAELGAVLEDRSRWALFSMREDFIAQLDPFLDALPTRLASRFRLDRLSAGEARKAARFPALEEGVEFDEVAAAELVENLRMVRVRRGAVESNEPGPFVEPVVLQVVCRRIWEGLADEIGQDGCRIGVEDIRAMGDVDRALAEFCDEQIENAKDSSGVPELVIRDWIENDLITNDGFRDQVNTGPGGSSAVLNGLEGGHFLRAESRRGTMWYEIAHDRLSKPVLDSNDRWRRENLNPIQSQAREWADRDRPTAMLLRDEILDEASDWAEGHLRDFVAVDREFLDASRAEQSRIDSAKRSQRRDRRVAVFASTLAVLAAVATIFAVSFWIRADKSRDEADAARSDAEKAQLEAEAARRDADQTADDLAVSLDEIDELTTKADEAQERAYEAGEALAEAKESGDVAEQATARAAAQEAAEEAALTSAQAARAEADKAIALAKVARSEATTVHSQVEDGSSTPEQGAEAEAEALRTREAAKEAEDAAIQADLDALEITDSEMFSAESAAVGDLRAVAEDDRTFVSGLTNQWVAQISSKKPGVPDGTWGHQRILDDHRELRSTFQSRLLDSADYLSYSDPTFWISIAPIGFASDQEALDWCVENEFDPDDCFAKLISDDATIARTVSYQS